jgi:hypothetical protein
MLGISEKVYCFEAQEARVTPIELTTEQRKEIERRRKGTLDRRVHILDKEEAPVEYREAA